MDYFNRKIDYDLLRWSGEQRHKSLMLRGSRQIGKTSAVRNLGKNFKYFVEINFENKDFVAVKTIFAQHSNRYVCDFKYAMK